MARSSPALVVHGSTFRAPLQEQFTDAHFASTSSKVKGPQALLVHGIDVRPRFKQQLRTLYAPTLCHVHQRSETRWSFLLLARSMRFLTLAQSMITDEGLSRFEVRLLLQCRSNSLHVIVSGGGQKGVVQECLCVQFVDGACGTTAHAPLNLVLATRCGLDGTRVPHRARGMRADTRPGN
eukprot:CAMPEP_0194496292 /NCGR_PEP_ID=MMETSP0253-20130528/13619_1 /TAXON_ID=2966 /ORGANISM="Noctiluca scintillans" /LENGTH=179 /DNA_ID=CAMNT_0039337673 /DNA_START=511 /DNA_END=1050 /DNA_ORIENTATION=-